jgi:tetratricopeptide (TPR) repeat protein
VSQEAKDLQDRGIKLYGQHDYEAAARVFQQAKDAYDAAQMPEMAAEMQTNIGLVHRALGQHQQALDAMQAALTYFEEHNDQRRLAQVLGNMGGVYREIGDKEQAYTCYRQAADLFDELGEDTMYGETMLAMATIQFRDGKIWPAAATYEVGLEHLDSLNFRQKILRSLINVRNRLSGTSNTTSTPDSDQTSRE